jgi:hypothetical protein
MSKFDVLVGHKIRKVFVAEGEESMAFVTDAGTFAFETEGDCCSETWFADLIGFKALIATSPPNYWGGQVFSAEDFELPSEEGGRSRQEYDDVMGVRLKTHAGVCEILYRNSSNGYYGGSISRVFVPESLEGWKEITGDWSA